MNIFEEMEAPDGIIYEEHEVGFTHPSGKEPGKKMCERRGRGPRDDPRDSYWPSHSLAPLKVVHIGAFQDGSAGRLTLNSAGVQSVSQA